MAVTHKAISTFKATSGSVSNITFSNIPSTYDDLRLLISVRRPGTTLATGMFNLQFNSDTTGSNYEGLYWENTGNMGTNVPRYRDQDRAVGWINSATATSDVFSVIDVYIPNYATTNRKKGWVADSITENNASTAYTGILGNVWKSTSAITSIILDTTSGDIAQHSSATLYGIKRT